MNEAYRKLIRTLQSIFEMDKADLDFGIYRIMNQKRDEINRFLENDLLPQVQSAFANVGNESKAELQKQLSAEIEQARKYGAPDPENSPAVLEIKKKLENSVDATALENEVFSKLQTFFSRYYDKGDFISQRRYKADTYAIPYEGEEVKLYWANHDQYYIKSSEHLKDYAFVAKDSSNQEKLFRIRLVEADTEKDNIKSKSGEERRFVIHKENPLSINDGELVINFQFVPVGKKAQDKLNSESVETIFSVKDPEFNEWLELLKTAKPTEKNKDRTLLEKHLNDFTARNTFDYFIHKDLGGFLKRELDFFIKNEVIHLDDLDEATFELTQAHLTKAKIIRKIAGKLIVLLEQIEDFQKRLWLKKKFITKTNYCFTIDYLDDYLKERLLSNDTQWQYWKRLNLVKSIERSERIKTISENPNLMADTAFFDCDFKEHLEQSIDDLDNTLSGELFNSENFQAANLFLNKYKNKCDLVYLDPPYNTDATPILYKNGYKESSWACLMADRIKLSNILTSETGIVSYAIDDAEGALLKTLISQLSPEKEVFQCIVEHYPGSGTGRSNVSRTHEYCLFSLKKDSDLLRGDKVENGERERGFRRAGTGDNNFRIGNPGRPESFYAVLVDQDTFEVIGAEPPPKIDEDYPVEDTAEGFKRIYPIGEDGSERVWTLSYEGGLEAIKEGRIISSPNFVIKRVYKDKERRLLLPSIWQGKPYNATTGGTNLLTGIFGESGKFSYPKSLGTMSRVVDATLYDRENAIVLDLFGGSGTTAHAVFNYNLQNQSDHKYILVEMGDHADSVIKERICKMVFSSEWRSGMPQNPNKPISHLLRYHALESYEDSLNNIEFRRPNYNTELLKGNDSLREDYTLKYMLDAETKESPSLLPLENFSEPNSFHMDIGTGSAGSTKLTYIDLIWTFNYLLGLTVESVSNYDNFKIISGKLHNDEKVAVIWRLHEGPSTNLDSLLNKLKISPPDSEYDLIYVNGDHVLEDPHSKVKLIEAEFKRLMFDVQDI